jgi:orotate phosphoribosyltransferase
MVALHITTPWIQSESGVLRLCGDCDFLRSLDLDTNASILGAGIGGHLVASLAAFAKEKNSAFVRKTVKDHGTCKQLDGSVDADGRYVAFCSTGDLHWAQRILPTCGVRIDTVIVIEQRTGGEVLDSFRWNCNLDVEHAVLHRLPRPPILSGKFTLSSGKQASGYYETLALANDFCAVSYAWAACSASLKEDTTIIGISFGGTYLAVAGAAINGSSPTVVDVAADHIDAPAKIPASHLLFIDDFVSTGRSFEVAASRVDAGGVLDTGFVSMYGYAKSVRVRGTPVKVLRKLERL